MIVESKLDDSFAHGQFLIDGFHTSFRFDHNKNGGEILLYVRKDIPAKILSHDFPSAESFFVEIILHKKEMADKLHIILIRITSKIILK